MARKFSLANSAPSKTAGLSAAAAAAKLAQKAKPVQPGNDLSATQNNFPQDDPTKKGFAADPGLGTTFTPPNDQTQGGGEDVTANPAKAGKGDEDDGRKPDPDIANSWKTFVGGLRNSKDALGHGSEKRGESGFHPIVKRTLVEGSVTNIGQFSSEEHKALEKAVKDGYLKKGKGGGFPVLKTVYANPGFDIENDHQASIDNLHKISEMEKSGALKPVYNSKNSSYTDQIRALRVSQNSEFHPASEVQSCKLLCNSALLNDMSDADKDAAYISALDAYRAGRDLTEQEQAVLGEAMADDGLATPVVDLAFVDDGDDEDENGDVDENVESPVDQDWQGDEDFEAEDGSVSPDLMNTGTSEGVTKSWESRRQGLSGKYIDSNHYKVDDKTASALAADFGLPRHGYAKQVNIPSDMQFKHKDSNGNWNPSSAQHNGTGDLLRTPLRYHDGKDIARGWSWSIMPSWKSENWPVVNSKNSSYTSLIQSIRNTGTSEGNKKGWETRRGVGYDNTEKGERPTRKPIGTTTSGKSVPHVNDKVYQMVEPRAKWNRRVSPMNSDFEGGKILRERLREDGWTKQDHDEAAQMHLDKSRAASKKWGKVAEEAAQQTYGRSFEPTDYRISGIADDKFSDAHKDALRQASRDKSESTSAAYAHFIAAGHRNLEPIREASQGMKKNISDKLKNSSTNTPCPNCGSTERNGVRGMNPKEWACGGKDCRCVWEDTADGIKPAGYAGNPAHNVKNSSTQPKPIEPIKQVQQLTGATPAPVAPSVPEQKVPLANADENSEISSNKENLVNHAAGSKWPVGKTRSGKSIKHTSHETYSKAELRKGHEGEISPLGDVFTGADMLKERLPDWTPEEHTDAAAAHLRAAQKETKKLQGVQDEQKELEKPQPPEADKLKHKQKSFDLGEKSNAHKKNVGDHISAAEAHWKAAGNAHPVNADILLANNESEIENTEGGKVVEKNRKEELLNGVPMPIELKMLNAKFVMTDPSGWVNVATFGDHEHAATGLTQHLDNDSMDAMVNELKQDKEKSGENWGGRLVDFDHKSDLSPETTGAGWVQDLEKRPDTGLWAKIKFSDLGEQAVQGGRFKYLSPVWNRSDCKSLGGNVISPQKILKVALTNSPNILGLVPMVK